MYYYDYEFYHFNDFYTIGFNRTRNFKEYRIRINAFYLLDLKWYERIIVFGSNRINDYLYQIKRLLNEIYCDACSHGARY